MVVPRTQYLAQSGLIPLSTTWTRESRAVTVTFQRTRGFLAVEDELYVSHPEVQGKTEDGSLHCYSGEAEVQRALGGLGLLSSSTGEQTYSQQTLSWVFHPGSLCTPFLKVRSRCTCLTLFLACWQILDGLCPGKPIAHSQQKTFNYITKIPCSLTH